MGGEDAHADQGGGSQGKRERERDDREKEFSNNHYLHLQPQFSRWSDKVSLHSQSLPGELFVTIEPKGPTEALLNWDLADKVINNQYLIINRYSVNLDVIF